MESQESVLFKYVTPGAAFKKKRLFCKMREAFKISKIYVYSRK